jgi:hypothetical protein
MNAPVIARGSALFALFTALLAAVNASPVAAFAPRCDGYWHIAPVPPKADATLTAIDGQTEDDIWAVGRHVSQRGLWKTLVEHWDGAAWRLMPTAHPGVLSDLWGVAALSRNDVWAVGDYFDGVHQRALIEHWDGTAWTLVPGADLGTENASLRAVAAVSAGDIWAVGVHSTGGGSDHALIEHWDGLVWTAAELGPAAAALHGVAAASASDVWAVGSGELGTLTEHWDGRTWTVVPSPNTIDESVLRAVVTAGSGEVWAVGHSFNPSAEDFFQYTLAEHWDGAIWSIAPSPNVAPPPRKRLDDTLGGVAARTALDVWAVGDYAFAGGQRLHPHRTLVEHWNGVNWSIVPSPNLGTESNSLEAVTQIGEHTWAVGGAGTSALIEHICGFGS